MNCPHEYAYAERSRLLIISASPWSAIVLRISRALGRVPPAGDDRPSPYCAAAVRNKSVPAVPHVGLSTLLPVPSMLYKATTLSPAKSEPVGVGLGIGPGKPG